MELDRTSCLVLTAEKESTSAGCSTKALWEIACKPLIGWVLGAVRKAGISDVCLVTDDELVVAVAEKDMINRRFHAAQNISLAKGWLQSQSGDILVLSGDAPFFDSGAIEESYAAHKQSGAGTTLIGETGRICGLWTQAQALPDANDFNALCEALCRDEKPQAMLPHINRVTQRISSPQDFLGANEDAATQAVNRHMTSGVLFISRSGVVIGPDVEIEAGATILPGTILSGLSRIGAGSVIGPNTVLCNTSVGKNSRVNASQATDSVIGDDVTLGPFSHLRPGSILGNGAKIGDFVEIKNSTIGEGTSVAHLTYIGDAQVGRYCNFGCGVVFVNYDGQSKNQSVIKDFAFVGCNTNIIAPVTVGEGAYTAAGVTVTKDVPDGALAVGRVVQDNKEGWAEKKLASYIEKKSKAKER